MSDRSLERWCFAAICVVALLAYSRSFSSPFNLDDYAFIVGNPILEQPTFDTAFGFARARVLPFATFILNHQIGGEEELGYHVVNFVIHLLATLAVYRLVLGLCRSPRLQGTRLAAEPLPLAAAAAFIFACHPIQIQAVTYIVQRITSLATLFYVGAVLLYVRGRNIQTRMETGWPALAFAGAAVLTLAAFLSKESAASLPFAIMLTEWTLYPGEKPIRRLLRLTPFVLLVGVIPLTWYLLVLFQGKWPTTVAELAVQLHYFIDLIATRAHPRGKASPLNYLLTQCIVIPRYLRLVLVPWGFNIDHDVPLVPGWSFTVAAGLAFLATVLCFGIYALRRWPLVGFGIVWCFLALSVESSVLPIQDTMVEHRMYMAMPGVALLLGVAFAAGVSRWRSTTLIVGGLVAVALCALTFLRNELWREPIRLWEDALAQSPGKARVHANLGTALHHAGRLDEAITHYCRALKLDPKSHQAETNAYTAMAEKMEQGMRDYPLLREKLLEKFKVGEDGTIELDVPDPCRRRKPPE